MRIVTLQGYPLGHNRDFRGIGKDHQDITTGFISRVDISRELREFGGLIITLPTPSFFTAEV
jgi:hypothetical protein